MSRIGTSLIRTTTLLSSESLLNQLRRTQVSLFETERAISSGMTVNTPSDAPDLTSETIGLAAHSISVVGDGSPQFDRARELLEAAELVLFLGFGFHKESVGRFGIFDQPWDDDRRSRTTVRGTCLDIRGKHQLHVVRDVLNGACGSGGLQNRSVGQYLMDQRPFA